MAKKILGYTIEIGGETTKLDKALSGVETSSKNVSKELREVDRALKFDPGNTVLLTQKQKLLADEIGNTSGKLDILKEASRQAYEQLERGEITEEQFRATQREVEKTENRLKYLEDQAKKTEGSLSNWDKVQDNIGKVGEKAEKAGKAFLPVTGAVVAAGGAAVGLAANFDSSMSQVQAVSGATAEDMEVLREKAREMGATTKFSASEAGDAMNYMAMAGWKTQDMLGGIEGIMNLAAASGEDLATTSDIVTDALTAFGMTAQDSTELADVLAAASSNANTNVSMMGESFKYVAPVAGSLGYSCQDTSIALGLMANAGIKASQSGTSLRAILTRMAAPPKEAAEAMSQLGLSLDDGNGKMYTMREVMDQLRAAFGDCQMDAGEFQASVAMLDEQLAAGEITQKKYDSELEALADNAFGAEGALKAQYAAAIAGKDSMSGLLAIVGASDDDYKKLCEAVDSASDSVEYNGQIYEGTAEKMAAVMQDNLAGQWTILKSQLEELGISFGELLMPAIQDVVGGIQDFVDWLNKLSPETKEQIIKMAALAAATGPVLIGFGKMSQGASALMKGAKLLTGHLPKLGKSIAATGTSATAAAGSTTALTGSLGMLVGGVGAVAAGVAIAGVASAAYVKHLDNEKLAADATYAAYRDLTNAAKEHKDASEESAQAAQEIVASYETNEEYADRLTEKLGALIEKEELSTTEKLQMKDAVDQLNELYPDLGLVYDENTGSVKDNTDEVIMNTEKLKENLEQAQTNARERAYLDAIQKQTEALVNSQMAYANASDATSYYREKMDECQQKMKELEDAGQKGSDEYNQLSQDFKLYSDSWNDSAKTLEGLHQSMGDSFEQLLLMQNQLDTGGLDEIGDGMIQSLDEAVKKAEEAGYSIPSHLTEGIYSKQDDPRDAAKFISSLMNFQDGVDSAGKFGGQIPQEMAYEMLTHNSNMDDATKAMNDLIEFSDALEGSRKAGQEIPEGMAKQITDNRTPLETNLLDLKQWILGVTKDTKDGVTTYSTDTMRSVESTISGSDADRRAQAKAGGVLSGLIGIDPVSPMRRMMIDIGDAISGSDADQTASTKGTDIRNGLDFSGMSGIAASTVGSINRSLDDLTTYKEINVSLRSSWAGNPNAQHADGGIFRTATLIPSLKGANHVVGEGGQAEAILPLNDFYRNLDDAVLSAMSRATFSVKETAAPADPSPAILQKMEEVCERLEKAFDVEVDMDGKKVARIVAPGVNRELGREAKKR